MISPSPLEQHVAPTLHPRPRNPIARALAARLHREPAERGPAADVAITIRAAGTVDGAAIARLQQLDGRPLPAGPHLLAEAGGRVVAAADVQTGATVADPFSPSAGVVSLLRLRAQQLRIAEAA